MPVFLLPGLAWGEPLRLAFEQYPPYEYVEYGELKGTSIDLLNSVCRKLDLTPAYVEAPFARALYDAERGAVDGLFSLFRTPEREAFLYYADEPLGETVTSIVTRSNSGVQWDGLESLYKYSVGKVRGYHHGEAVDSMQGLKLTEVASNVLLLRMLDSGRIDIALTNRDVLAHLHGQGKHDWKLVTLKELVHKSLYVGFSRATGEHGRKLAEDFGRILRELKGRE